MFSLSHPSCCLCSDSILHWVYHCIPAWYWCFSGREEFHLCFICSSETLTLRVFFPLTSLLKLCVAIQIEKSGIRYFIMQCALHVGSLWPFLGLPFLYIATLKEEPTLKGSTYTRRLETWLETRSNQSSTQILLSIFYKPSLNMQQ